MLAVRYWGECATVMKLFDIYRANSSFAYNATNPINSPSTSYAMCSPTFQAQFVVTTENKRMKGRYSISILKNKFKFHKGEGHERSIQFKTNMWK